MEGGEGVVTLEELPRTVGWQGVSWDRGQVCLGNRGWQTWLRQEDGQSTSHVGQYMAPD
jgi:hypothetical protein